MNDQKFYLFKTLIFRIVKQETRALISLIRALVGPQQLQLNVDIKDGPIRIVEKISIEIFVI